MASDDGQRVDLEHFFDWSHSRNRFFRKLANAKGERARQFAIEIDRAPAHARHYTGVFRFGAVQTNQNNVAFRTIHVVHHAQNFDVHRFGRHTLEHGERGALHAFMDLIERNDGRRFQRERGCVVVSLREDPDGGGEAQKGGE